MAEDSFPYEDLYTKARAAGQRIPYAPNDPYEQDYLTRWNAYREEGPDYAREGTPFTYGYGFEGDVVGRESLGDGQTRYFFRDGSQMDIGSNESLMGNILGSVAKFGTIAGLGAMTGGALGVMGAGATLAGAGGGVISGGLAGGTAGEGFSGSGALKGAAIGGVAGAVGGYAKGLTDSGTMGSVASSLTRTGLGAMANNLMSSTQEQQNWPENVMPTESFNTTQGVTQPGAEDLSAFSGFGRSQISSMGRSQRSQAKDTAAARGMGTGSGSLYGDINVINMRNRKAMEEFARMMSDPNMGYEDINAFLANILV